jgi:PST family polysaccharide transporter
LKHFGKFQLTRSKSALLKNTVMLYILTFSTYLMSFIVVPYETRVLQTEKYGLVGVATAIMVYFQLIIDFGFLLSATEEVSRHREDKKRLSVIFTSVTVNKLLLTLCSGVVLLVLCRVVSNWRENTLFFFLCFIATAVNSLIPDYLYRGIEQMSIITIRTVLIKLFFTVMIFLLLRSPSDYYVIPVLNIIGNTAALVGVYVHLFRKLKIGFVRCSLREVWGNLRRSMTFFLSRIASTAYTAANTIILDILSAGTVTAFYSCADKLVTTAKNGLSPISDSLYPYMTKNRDFKLVKKVLMVIMPVILVGCAVVFIWAEPLCTWFFGEGYEAVAPVLRAMLPVVVVILPSYILGFPTLSAMGLSQYANYSVIFSSALHIVNLLVLYFTGHMNMVTLGVLVSVAETATLVFRVVVILLHRDRLRPQEEQEEKEA